ncbi:MAG: ABC transporter ATP-binding protein [Candidatus Omnitrophica bacterium]|nr:ABC transporter ATP-binding protein [Candidatus Omnitrophota bacterium]
MIDITGLSKRYGATAALHDVTLRVEPKERMVICGHSGCGKTTLLRLIAGLDTPDGGEIHLNRQLASNATTAVAPARRNIAMVFQDLALWPHLSVAQNIAFGLERVISDRNARRDEVANILQLLRLEGKAASAPSELSGGEQQRVALGRAIIRRPSILLMDEPLAHVDDELRDALTHLMLDLQARFGMTLVYVTHDRDLAARMAGSQAFMSHGRIERVERSHA